MVTRKVKFLFIQSEHENIGIEYLSACLKRAGHHVQLLFFPKAFDNVSIRLIKTSQTTENLYLKHKLSTYKANVVAFSPFTSQYRWCLSKAKYIKHHYPHVYTLFGGVHVNSVPGYVIKNKYVDGILIGEADYTIVDFANHYHTHSFYHLKSFWGKKNNQIIKNPIAALPDNLDLLPFPDKQLFYSQIPKSLQSFSYVIMGSRGCPFSCTYCSNNVYNKLYSGQKRLRFRSPQNIISELLDAKNKYKFDRVEFMDDVFAVDQTRLINILALYKKHINIPFSCFLHPQFVNELMIKKLKNSGCYWLKMGVQSANEHYRKHYLHRLEKNKDLIKISKLCHKHHLNFSFDHIFNLPGETKSHLVQALKLYNLCHPTIINFGSLIYLPKTDIIKKAIKLKILNSEDVTKINQGLDPVLQSSNIDRLSHQTIHRQKVNISAFSLMFILITILPSKLNDFLIRHRFYNLPFVVPNYVIVPFKIISKIRAHQFYLYYSAIKASFVYTLASINLRSSSFFRKRSV